MAISVLHRTVFRFILIFQDVTQRLSFADVCLRQLLRNWPDLGKVFQLQSNVCRDPIPDNPLFGLVLVHGLNRKESYCRELWIQTVGAQDLPHLIYISRGALICRLRTVILDGDAHLNLGSIGSSFVFAVSANVDTIGLRGDSGMLLGKALD